MALAFQSNDPIKQAIYEELANLLSPEREIRTSAEERMKQLEITEGYGVFLAEMTINQQSDIGLRQLASVMLKKYVEEHWNGVDSDDMAGCVATDLAKKMIRSILPNGLYDSNSKIRTSVAYTIATIASLDWPHTWTELFDIIVKCLSENEHSIHGAMQVLIEFTHDLEDQIKVVGPLIMTEVYRIFEAEQVYNVQTRTCAVKIFKSLFRAINTYVDRNDVDKMLNPVMPGFIEKITLALVNPNVQVSSFELKTEALKVLQFLVNEMPHYMRPFIGQILPPVWQLLTQTADVYVKVVVNANDPNQSNQTDDDAEDELSNFTTMILQLAEFISSICEHSRFRAAIKNVLTDLIYIMIVYQQLTEEQIDSWTDDSDRLTEDEYQGGVTDSVRMSCHEVLECLLDKFSPKILLKALTEALARHVSVAEAEQTAGNRNYWKIHEASIFTVGSYRDFILANPKHFDLAQYLNYVRNLMSPQMGEYLLPRCMLLLSRYIGSDVYTAQTLNEVLDMITVSIQPDKPIHVRVFAVRAIYEICDSLKECTDSRHDLVASKLNGYLDGIFALFPIVKDGIMSVLIEVVTLMTGFDANFAASNPRLIPLTIAIFLKYKDDPFLLQEIQELLKILSQNPYCLKPLQEKIVPTLTSILNAPDDVTFNTMQDVALEVLQTIVKHSTAPLSEQLIDSAFPAAIHCILRTDDSAVMQSGGECVRQFVSVASEQVFSYKNGEGLNYIMEVTKMLLDPMNSEYSAVFAGRLVITIITRAGNLLKTENIYLILKAVISKMQLADSLNVAMSLIMTFAHLFVTQMEAVLNFLSTVPGPTGEPAIQFVFSNWLRRQDLFYGKYERNVSVMALCKIFEYGVTTKDIRLTSVTVRDQTDHPAALNSRRTRSQTAAAQPAEWTTIPVLVKIFKLLINEMCYLKDLKAADELDAETDEEGDDDDNNGGGDDDDIDNDNNLDAGNPSNNKILTSSCMFDDDEDEENNELILELMQDPIFQSSMEENLTKFLQNFSRDEHFGQFMEHLTERETKILEAIQ